MNRDEALKELKSCIEEYHIDLSKYKITFSEVLINSYDNSLRTLFVTFESKINGRKLDANIEYDMKNKQFGYYNINI